MYILYLLQYVYDIHDDMSFIDTCLELKFKRKTVKKPLSSIYF